MEKKENRKGLKRSSWTKLKSEKYPGYRTGAVAYTNFIHETLQLTCKKTVCSVL